jgi:glycosyltransferase involved in cell wall biosynthesis
MDNHMAFVAQRTGIAGRLGYILLRFMTRRTMNGNVSGFLGVGQESCDFLIREQGVPPDKVGHLAIGVDTEMFRPDLQARNRARKAYGIPLEAKVVMQTGKLSPDKSPEWLAEAVAPIMEHCPDVWLVFVGGGAAHELEIIQTPIERAGVSNRMKVLAAVAVPKLADMFNMADVCVYPNGSSLSCMEAAASGRPVIVTDLPWGLERQRAGVTVCYQTGNIDDLRGKIRWLLSDLDARDGIGRRARQAVMENFSYDKIAHRSEDMMREAIASYSFA